MCLQLIKGALCTPRRVTGCPFCLGCFLICVDDLYNPVLSVQWTDRRYISAFICVDDLFHIISCICNLVLFDEAGFFV